MFEHLPDWVSIAYEWVVAIFLGMSGIAVTLLVCGIIACAIRMIRGKDDEL